MAFNLQSLMPGRFRRDLTVIPVVRLSGTIGSAAGPFRSGLSLSALEGPLERAFAFKAAPVVALIVNSPGGAAVQSHLIFKRIRALAEEKGKKVVVAVEDVAASGGYMIAAAADEIIVDPSSIVGSIGVVSAGFGFPKLLEKVGVERRVHTAGESKSMLDPFQPEKPEDVARLEALQRDVHAMFIDLVKSRRAASLKESPDLFTGAFWSGAKAVELGLADRIGDLRSVMRERYGDTVRFKSVSTERNAWRRRLGLAGPDRFAGALVDRMVSAVDERLLWNRFGL